MLSRLPSFLRAFIFRSTFERRMSDELTFHLQAYTDDLIQSGLSPAEADRRARVEFGGVNTVQADCRQAFGLRLADELWRQVRYSARLLRKTPGFTITAVLSLALCLGANLTIFAAVRSILVRPLPFPEASRLVTIYNTYPRAGVERDGSSLTNYYERRGHIPAFSSLAIYRYGAAIVGQSGWTAKLKTTDVSPDFFSTLGVNLAMGRTFSEEETTFQNNSVAIITDTYWRNYFSADPQVLGKRAIVNTRPMTIIGVLPAGFRFLSSEALLYFPLSSSKDARGPLERHHGGNSIQMIARLNAGATTAQAQSQIDSQNNALEVDDPQGKMMAEAGFRSVVVSLHGDHVASIRPVLLLLQAGGLILLLIGAVNLANLLLVRSGVRVRELAVRQAIGASRVTVISEAIVETTLLATIGGALSIVIGAFGTRLLAALGVNRLPLGSQITFDVPLGFLSFGAAILIGIVLSAPVACFSLRQHLDEALKSESRSGTTSLTAQRWRYGFIVAQIALSFVLLAGASLLGLSLKRAAAVSPGFESSHVLSAQIALIGNKYPAPIAGLNFAERLVNALENQPGLQAAGFINNVPFSGFNPKSAATVKGHAMRTGESPQGHYSYGVGGNYFRAMGFSLREGRFLTASDSRRTELVCVVDEDFAHYYWPHATALGQQVYQGSDPRPGDRTFTVVGVVKSVKQAALTDETTQGAIYYPYIYQPDSNIYVVAQGMQSPEHLLASLRNVVRQIDPELALTDVRTMEDRIDETLVARRSPTFLAALFSAIALMLTAIGIYGVLSYSVAQRIREIGVRMALGARPAQICMHFVAVALRLLIAGALIGIGGTWLMGGVMRVVLFHVRPFESNALLGAASLVVSVALGACLLPALRASRISPISALAEN